MNVLEILDLFSLIANRLSVSNVIHLLSTCTTLYNYRHVFIYNDYVCTSSNNRCYVKIKTHDILNAPLHVQKLQLELNDVYEPVHKPLDQLIKLNIEYHNNCVLHLFRLNLHQFQHLHTLKILIVKCKFEFITKTNQLKRNLLCLPDTLQILVCNLTLWVKIPLGIRKLKLSSNQHCHIENAHESFLQLHSFRDNHQLNYNYMRMMPNCKSLNISNGYDVQFEIPLTVKKLSLHNPHHQLDLRNHTIEKLELSSAFDNAYIQWPITLKRLTIHAAYHPFVAFDFPSTLTRLTLKSFTDKVKFMPSIPHNLQQLTIKSEAYKLIMPEYPTNLIHLKIYTQACHDFDIHDLPRLKRFIFRTSEKGYNVHLQRLPSLKYLSLQRFDDHQILNQPIKHLHYKTFNVSYTRLPDCEHLIIDQLNAHIGVLKPLLPSTLQSLIVRDYYGELHDHYRTMFDDHVRLKYVKINHQRLK